MQQLEEQKLNNHDKYNMFSYIKDKNATTSFWYKYDCSTLH